MPLVDHLEELRTRILWSILAFVPVSVAAFFFTPQVLKFLIFPAHKYLKDVVFLGPTEAFFVYVKLAMFIGLIVSSPVLLYNLIAFILPGLTPTERRYLFQYLPVALALFVAGAAFAYFVFLPIVLHFLMGFGGPVVRPMITLSNYLGFVANLVLPFGLVFELPVVVSLLTRLGIISPEFLVQKRKYAILVIFVIAGALAPPDLFSMLVMAMPMLLLYEASIVVARLSPRPEETTVEPPES